MRLVSSPAEPLVPAGRRRAGRLDALLLGLVLCVPVPLLAATGLSIPLPTGVVDAFASIVPGGGEAAVPEAETVAPGERAPVVGIADAPRARPARAGGSAAIAPPRRPRIVPRASDSPTAPEPPVRAAPAPARRPAPRAHAARRSAPAPVSAATAASVAVPAAAAAPAPVAPAAAPRTDTRPAPQPVPAPAPAPSPAVTVERVADGVVQEPAPMPTDPAGSVVAVPVGDDGLPVDLPVRLPVDEALSDPVTDAVESVPTPREIVDSVVGSPR